MVMIMRLIPRSGFLEAVGQVTRSIIIRGSDAGFNTYASIEFNFALRVGMTPTERYPIP
jgi:hypothetical protein